ncbi:MAG: hypothetical protein R2728_00760 [Chitinophagales bacterium]
MKENLPLLYQLNIIQEPLLKRVEQVVFPISKLNPNLVNQPQRTIADYAGVSLGTVPKVIEGLKQEGFLIKLDNKNYQLINYLNYFKNGRKCLKINIASLSYWTI